jgi:imidazolonepropionase
MRARPDEVIERAAVVIVDDAIAWSGSERDLPAVQKSAGMPVDLPELDAEGRVVIPGFVDPHTHLIWAGTRREEFVARLAGQQYDGGGINTTVAATRAASDDDLLRLALERGRRMIDDGTTTVEIKTGYGLTPHDELRCLDVITRLGEQLPWHVEPTYLGAHVVPDGRDRDEYVDEVIATIPDAAHRGARWVDVFCDVGVFTIEETRRIIEAGRVAGLSARLHAEEIGHTGAASLAAETGCASADHLEHVTPQGARAMASAGVVGVLLPSVTLSLRTFEFGQYRVLREAGVELALSTDCNPGTSWCESMPYVVQLACLVYGMPVHEALWAATRGGAGALRRTDAGRVEADVPADLAILDVEHEADLVAHLGAANTWRTVVDGAVWTPMRTASEPTIG